ncbi:MAG: MFS transporter [Deltaproteobacteria bacterium]|nr:MFS transporter [Deltaproteobacteria bacterium]
MSNSNGPSDGYLLSKANSYYIFSLLFLLYMFDYIDRMVVVSLFPYLQKDWGLTDTQCGLLVSTVYWSIVLFSFPVSIIIDRWSRKKSIGIMAVLWSIATASCAFANNFTHLFIARSAIGLGEAGYAPGGTAMISALFPEKKRAMLVGLWNISIPLGSAIGVALGGYIAARYGWRQAFGLVALPGLIIALLFFFVRDYKTVELVKSQDTGTDGPAPLRLGTMDIIREFSRTPSLLLTYVGFAGNTFLTTSLLSWLPTYLHRFENLPMEKASVKGSLVLLMAIIGSPLGGYLADKWLKKRGNARLLFGALSSTVTALIFILAFGLFSGKIQYGLFLMGGVTAIAFASSAIAVTQDVVHPGLRAVSYSICVIAMNLLGSSLGPIVTGFFSDQYNIRTALLIVSFFPLLAGLFFYLGSFFYEKDLAKVEKIPVRLES